MIIDKFKIKITCEVEQIKAFEHQQIRIMSNVFVLAVSEQTINQTEDGLPEFTF